MDPGVGNSYSVRVDQPVSKRGTMKLGSLEEYPTKELATNAVNALRICINAEAQRHQRRPLRMCDLIDHYILTELSPTVSWHSRRLELSIARFSSYGSDHTGAEQTFATFAPWRWNTQLCRHNKEAFSSSTKAKIRSLTLEIY